MKDTKIISGFPGIGKSFAVKALAEAGVTAMDSDSSTFDKEGFPGNYIAHINKFFGRYDYIFISTHAEVRDNFHKLFTTPYLIYPDRRSTVKKEYMKRYRDRGDSEEFIQLVNRNWGDWLSGCSYTDCSHRIQIFEGTFLLDVLPR